MVKKKQSAFPATVYLGFDYLNPESTEYTMLTSENLCDWNPGEDPDVFGVYEFVKVVRLKNEITRTETDV